MNFRLVRTLFALLACAGFTLWVSDAAAQEPEVREPEIQPEAREIHNIQELMDEMAGKVTQASSWSADIEQVMNMGGMVISTTGVIASKGKMKIAHLTVNMMGTEITIAMVTDASGITWMEVYAAGQHMVTKMDMQRVEEMGGAAGGLGSMNPMGDSVGKQDPTQILEMLSRMGDLTYKGEGTVEDGAIRVHLIEGQMDADMAKLMAPQGQLGNMGIEMSQFRVAIGADDGFPRHVEFSAANGQRVMTMDYKNVEINPEIPDEAFVYEPPQGVMVMDLTAMMGSQFDAIDIGTADMGNLSEAEKESLAEMGIYEVEAPESNYNRKLSVGEPAPDFTTTGLGGASVSLSDFRGSPLLIDFWASDSKPSVSALDEVVEVKEKYGVLGLRIVGVSLDSSRENLSRFLATHARYDWPQIYDGMNWNGDMVRAYGVEAIPYRLLIDGEGMIRGVRLRGDALDEAARELVSGSAP